MERNVGSKKSVYGMLMAVLFYTTGIICGLRMAWLAMHTLIPAISRTIIALYYQPSSTPSYNPAPPTPASGGGDAAGMFYKLVRTAAGHDLLVPVPTPVSMYHISADSAGEQLRRTLALIALLVSAGSFATYCYLSLVSKATPVQRGLSAWARGKITLFARETRAAGNGTSTESSAPTPAPAKTKLNPAAPAFHPSSSRTPSPAPPPLHRRLDPTARTFAPRRGGGCATPPSPADSTDSAGPATPSPSCLPNAFALAAARVVRAAGTAGKGVKNAGGRHPVGVGKMRVVRPEEVVEERRAGEVFVFF